jgi:hypothetical protein
MRCRHYIKDVGLNGFAVVGASLTGWSTPGKGSTIQMELPTRAELRKAAI